MGWRRRWATIVALLRLAFLQEEKMSRWIAHKWVALLGWALWVAFDALYAMCYDYQVMGDEPVGFEGRGKRCPHCAGRLATASRHLGGWVVHYKTRRHARWNG